MNAIRIRKQLDSPLHNLPELAPLIGKTVEIIVVEESADAATMRDREPGLARGEVTMSDDFDAPIDDFALYSK